MLDPLTHHTQLGSNNTRLVWMNKAPGSREDKDCGSKTVGDISHLPYEITVNTGTKKHIKTQDNKEKNNQMVWGLVNK